MTIRPPAVAGRFYDADPETLSQTIRDWLDEAATPPLIGPKAVIAPHAGYMFSGRVAASAFAAWDRWPERDRVRRVLLLGTAHSHLEGLGISTAEGFTTPLGVVPVDRAAVAEALELPDVVEDDTAHSVDHALEVQLPFLQRMFKQFQIVPVLVGRCRPEAAAVFLDRFWGGEETRIVISSDLSHYHTDPGARLIDARTAEAIERLDPAGVPSDSACGHRAINGLIQAVRRRGGRAVTAGLKTSADFGGPPNRVVGYGAFLFEDPARPAASAPQSKTEESMT